METKHTPGPWIVSEDGRSVFALETVSEFGTRRTRNRFWASLYGGPDTMMDETNANARLIAAAPDLLEAAELALAHIQRSGDWTTSAADAEEALENAIAKATGQGS